MPSLSRLTALCAALGVLAVAATPVQADARRDAHLLVSMFGSVCTQALTDPKAVRRLTRDFDAKRLPRKQSREIFDSEGQGWAVKAPFADLSIALVEPPACVVITDNADPDSVVDGFKAYVATLPGDGLREGTSNFADRSFRSYDIQINNAVIPYTLTLLQDTGSTWNRLVAKPLK
jgi:hypothetical protein